MRLGLVIARYAPDISGGAELHCRLVANLLARHPGAEVTVITTTARDYTVWDDHYPAGSDRDGPVEVIRFRPTKQRRLRRFDLINRTAAKLNGRAPAWLERLWLTEQGPHCPELIQHIKLTADQYDRLIFYTYLYEPTVLGLPARPGQAWLIPTAHDEPALRLKLVKPVFEQARAIGFLSPAERDLVRSRFNIAAKPTTILGSAVQAPAGVDPEGFKSRRDLDSYLLYLGRVDYHKGVPELLDFWAAARRNHPGTRLVLAGEVKMDLPVDDSVTALGFISEEDKWSALAGCLAVVAPSPYESLNLTVLEAGAAGRPVLVNGRCRVLKEYVEQSGGGAIYTDAASFAAGLAALNDARTGPDLAKANAVHTAEVHSQKALAQRLAAWLEL